MTDTPEQRKGTAMKTTKVTPAMLAASAQGLGMLAGTPDAIEHSEVLGQAELVNNTALPIDMRPDREVIEANSAIRFGDVVDDIFIDATLPAGWKKQATEHPMHSDLLDDKGRKRAAIFYKAAFYDRSAHMTFLNFYTVDGDWRKHEVKVLNANGDVIKDFGAVDVPERTDDPRWSGKYQEYETLQGKAREWLAANYPDYQNPFAYWD